MRKIFTSLAPWTLTMFGLNSPLPNSRRRSKSCASCRTTRRWISPISKKTTVSHQGHLQQAGRGGARWSPATRSGLTITSIHLHRLFEEPTATRLCRRQGDRRRPWPAGSQPCMVIGRRRAATPGKDLPQSSAYRAPEGYRKDAAPDEGWPKSSACRCFVLHRHARRLPGIDARSAASPRPSANLFSVMAEAPGAPSSAR